MLNSYAIFDPQCYKVVLRTDKHCESGSGHSYDSSLIRVHTVCYKDGLWVMEIQLMLTSMANIPVQTNIWDQDQTAPMRSRSILVASTTSFNNELVDDIWVVM